MANKVNPNDALSMGVYHFHPRWTCAYGDSYEKRIEEFEDVMKSGYFNTVIAEDGCINDDEFWRVVFENDATVWYNIWDYFQSDKGTFEEWHAERSKLLDALKQHPDRWERFLGFHFDEPVWRGQSNADFLEQTKNLRQMYGKRIFPVFATGEFSDSEGNAMQLNMDAANMKKLIPEALEYVTDVAFDSYSVDVREGFGNGDYIEKMHEKFEGIVDGKTYYSELTKLLVRIVGHDVNVWFFPCAYTTNLWRGGRVDEDYCVGHLDYFTELLKEQEYQGGIFLYTYKNNARNEAELGLTSHLIVTDENGNQKLYPDEPVWEKYSARLKEVCKEFSETPARHAKF